MADINLKKYAGQGQAVALFGTFLPDNIGNYPNVHVLSADMSAAASLSRYIYQNPDKYTEIGIAEQNLVGISAGMASEGFTPIAIAQAAFITMRAFEMSRQYLGYMKNKVILVGLNSGLYLQYFGNTHYCVEDISILRSIPDMTILSPADAGEAVMALDAALCYDGASYIRLTGGSQLRTVYNENCDFVIGKDIVVREGCDVCIFATGACVGNSIEAANILSVKYGIEAKGGLGSALSDYTSTKGGFPTILKLGIHDTFSKPGSYDYLMQQHRLTPELIVQDIFNKLQTL